MVSPQMQTVSPLHICGESCTEPQEALSIGRRKEEKKLRVHLCNFHFFLGGRLRNHTSRTEFLHPACISVDCASTEHTIHRSKIQVKLHVY